MGWCVVRGDVKTLCSQLLFTATWLSAVYHFVEGVRRLKCFPGDFAKSATPMPSSTYRKRRRLPGTGVITALLAMSCEPVEGWTCGRPTGPVTAAKAHRHLHQPQSFMKREDSGGNPFASLLETAGLSFERLTDLRYAE